MTIPDYDWPAEQAIAVKALWDGKADAPMQRMALKHLVEMLGGIHSIGFDPENPHVTAFHAGRRWIGRQVQNAIVTPLDKLVKEPKNESDERGIRTATERARRAIIDAKR